ncbi:O-antigen ligase family protein [Candidatus Pelagibacter sp.]|nr:O-antigen ligase family protein [Candidatus Pelagibacter sp.]
MYEKLRYNDLIIKYLLLSLPVLLISGPLLPEIAIGIIFFLIAHKIIKKEIKNFNKTFIYGFLSFYFFIIISSLLSDYVLLSATKTGFYIRFLTLTLSIYYILNNSNNFLILFKNILLIIFFILIFDGFYQYFFYENIIGMANANILRISSFFGKELIYGSYLCKFLPILIGLLIFFHKTNIDKTLIYLIIFISIIAIFISGERAAIILSLISILIIIFSTNFFNKSKFYIILLILTFLTIIINTNHGIKNKWKSTFENSIFNFSNNYIVINNKNYPLIFDKKYTYMTLSTFKMFKDKPILGHGVKSFRFNCKKEHYKIDDFDNYNFRLNCGNHPHNTYTQLIAETGIVGFGFIIFFFIFILFSLLKSIFNNQKKIIPNVFDFRICILSSIFINLFPFTTTGSFFNNWLSIVYFFPIGFLFYLNKTYKF